MKIEATESRYLIRRGGKSLLVEELRNSRGERVLSVQELSSILVDEESYWEPDTKDVKEVDFNDLPANVKRALRGLKLK